MPDPSLKRSATGMAPGPRGATGKLAPHGPDAMPLTSVQPGRQASQHALSVLVKNE